MTEKSGIVEYDDAALVEHKPVTAADSFIGMIERVATNPDADIDKMERLSAMRKEEQDRVAVCEYNKAMVKVQQQIPTIVRTGQNTQTNSTYAKMDIIINAVRPVLTKHGMHMTSTEGDAPEGMVRADMKISHIGGHSEFFHYITPVDMSGIKGNVNKTETHGKASGYSYALRYCVNAAFMLEFSNDKDGNAAGTVVGKITEPQAEKIAELISTHGLSPEVFLDWMKTRGVEGLDDLPAKHYRSVIKLINGAIEAKRDNS